MTTRSRRPRGAALLTAMLTVALVATLAAAALWQQWRGAEVEAAERGRTQAAWILAGALDWARLILRVDARAGGADHLGEPWALPLREARLSSFLAAAERDALADATADVRDAFLSGAIEDAQARLNLLGLTQPGAAGEAWQRAFTRLFAQLGISTGELDRITRGLAVAAAGGEGAPLMPQRLADLAWLGVPPAVVQALAPHATLLPAATPLNVNTASATVLAAAVEGLDLAGAQRLEMLRRSRPFASIGDAAQALGRALPAENVLDVRSSYFEVHGRLRLDQVVVEEHSLVLRRPASDATVVLWRTREARGVPGVPGVRP